jgi:hypothetical protein
MRHPIATRLASAVLAAGALLITAATAQAQSMSSAPVTQVYGRGFEIRPFAGGILPTGSERDLLTDAALVGAQLGWHFDEHFALTGSFGWAPSKDKTTAFGGNPFSTGRQEKLDLYQYDLGIEGRMPLDVTRAFGVAPYIGLGVGGRTYS